MILSRRRDLALTDRVSEIINEDQHEGIIFKVMVIRQLFFLMNMNILYCILSCIGALKLSIIKTSSAHRVYNNYILKQKQLERVWEGVGVSTSSYCNQLASKDGESPDILALLFFFVGGSEALIYRVTQ